MAIKTTQLPIETQLSNDDSIIVIKDGATKRSRIKDLNVEEISTINSDYTLRELDGSILCDASNNSITIQLLNSSALIGKQYEFKKIDDSTNRVTIRCAGTQLIDYELLSRELIYKNDFLVLRATPAGWLVIGETLAARPPKYIKMHDEITEEDIETEVPTVKSGINLTRFSKLVIDIDIIQEGSYIQLRPLTWNPVLEKYIPGNVSHRIMETQRILLDIQSPDDLYLLPIDVQGVVTVVVGGFNP